MIGLLLVFGFVGMYLGWPLLWDRFSRNLGRYGSYLMFMTNNPSATFSQQWRHWLLPLFAIPLFPWLCAAIGVNAVRRQGQTANRRLILYLVIWLLVPLVRLVQPGCPVYDGMRHYLEFLPAFWALGGIGFSRLVDWIGSGWGCGRRARVARIGVALLFVVAVVDPILTSIRLHPYEHTYFNRLIRCKSRAQRLGLVWAGDYFCVGFRDGAEIVNQLAPYGVRVAFHRFGWLPQVNGNLRPDLRLIGVEQAKEEDNSFVVVCDRGDGNRIWQQLQNEGFRLVATVDRLGETLVYVYQWPGRERLPTE